MTERERAIKIAKSMIDKRCVDPDCEQCILARQFLRAVERIDTIVRGGTTGISPLPNPPERA